MHSKDGGLRVEHVKSAGVKLCHGCCCNAGEGQLLLGRLVGRCKSGCTAKCTVLGLILLDWHAVAVQFEICAACHELTWHCAHGKMLHAICLGIWAGPRVGAPPPKVLCWVHYHWINKSWLVPL